jgi:hypothetical protein
VTLSVGEPGGGVEHAVAQPFRFSGGQITVQGKQLQPGDEVRSDRCGNIRLG